MLFSITTLDDLRDLRVKLRQRTSALIFDHRPANDCGVQNSGNQRQEKSRHVLTKMTSDRVLVCREHVQRNG